MNDDGYNEFYKRFDKLDKEELWDMYKEARARIDESTEDGNENMPISDADDALINYCVKFERGREMLDYYGNIFSDDRAEEDAELGNDFFGDKKRDINEDNEELKKGENKDKENPFNFPPLNMN
ncbi:MAG: hypothetical protein M3P22_00640 [bacterium]|nr:hypothetical protein [bacterium]